MYFGVIVIRKQKCYAVVLYIPAPTVREKKNQKEESVEREEKKKFIGVRLPRVSAVRPAYVSTRNTY